MNERRGERERESGSNTETHKKRYVPRGGTAAAAVGVSGGQSSSPREAKRETSVEM